MSCYFPGQLFSVSVNPFDAQFLEPFFLTQVLAKVLVGADGIWSMVRGTVAPEPPLEYLGVVVILGYCSSVHPLTDHRIFQTLDGETRIYVMPFCTAEEAVALSLPGNEDSNPFVMWQLSFPVPNVDTARDICRT